MNVYHPEERNDLVDCFANNDRKIFDAEPQRTRRDAELIRPALSRTYSPYT